MQNDFNPKSPFETFKTCGPYNNEADAVNRLEKVLLKADIFTIYREVCGEYEYRPHYKDSNKTPRIDFLLTPKKNLIDTGWPFGAIGIECKKSNVKIGKPLSQIMDYSTAVFRIPKFNILIKPDFIFLWPCESTHGDIASLMAQNRFGTVCETGNNSDWHRLIFFCGESRVLTYKFNGKIDIPKQLNFGKRTGSR